MTYPYAHKIIDTHAHFDDAAFADDRDTILASLPEHGVEAVLNNSVDLYRSADAVIELTKRYDFCYAAVGVHPENRVENGPLDTERLARLLQTPKVVALGEIGLDYHWEPDTADEQKALFAEQLTLSKDLNVPVIIHDREAHGDTLELIKKYHPTGTVHCFSGSPELAEEIVKAGLYLGIGGVVTFKNANKLVRIVERIPLDRLLLETDAPYLAPEPHRGEKNRSDLLLYVAERIADIKGIPTEDVLRMTAENAKRCYSI